MAAFEWMELQTLTSDIVAARSRLVAARSDKDHRRIRTLEQEISAAEERRARLLASLTTSLADTPHQTANEDAPANAAAPIVADDAPQSVELDITEGISGPGASSLVAAVPKNDSQKGDRVVWDQLTPSDLERARQELDVRRDEILAKHAEELRGLDADRDQLTALEQAISEFLRKFSQSTAEGEVVSLRAVGRG
jgi:hypothetical protein